MVKVAAVYLQDSSGEVRAHPVHREWLRSVGADEIIVTTPSVGPVKHTVLGDMLLNRDIPSKVDYDVIVFESPNALYCLPLVRSRAPGATLIFLDATWHKFGTGAYNFREFPIFKRPIYYADRWIDARIRRLFYRHYLDGVITVSKMMAEYVHSFSEIPLEIVRPTIAEEFAKQLDNIEPDLGSDTAVFVGASRGHKGTNLLVQAWPLVREKVPEATLKVVGSGHPDTYGQYDGVTVQGYVPDLAHVFETVSLQIHPARFDASPVSVLEGMRAGVPQVVTQRTGTKSEVSQIDPSLVVNADPESISKRVVSYFNSSVDSRRNYSETAREIARNFEEEARHEEFQRKFESLLAKLGVVG